MLNRNTDKMVKHPLRGLVVVFDNFHHFLKAMALAPSFSHTTYFSWHTTKHVNKCMNHRKLHKRVKSRNTPNLAAFWFHLKEAIKAQADSKVNSVEV